MPNSTYDFASSNGQTITFDAATDTLSFGSAFSAAQLRIVQGAGTGANATVIVTIGATSVTLKGLTIEALRSGALSFADGSLALIGDLAATISLDNFSNTLNGGTGNDYLNGLGGDDVLNAGDGNDTVLTGAGQRHGRGRQWRRRDRGRRAPPFQRPDRWRRRLRHAEGGRRQ
jgi:Ca2+-binding RTX toxin-like protein